MLAKRYRLIDGGDYIATIRRGRRVNSALAVVYQQVSPQSVVPRYGFVVSRAVGNAVVRNSLRRRLKSIAHDDLARRIRDEPTPVSVDIVIRALPAMAQADWVSLKSDISGLLLTVESLGARGTVRARAREMTSR